MQACILTKCVKEVQDALCSAVEMQVFTLGGPQGNIGQNSVLAIKPVSRKFIV